MSERPFISILIPVRNESNFINQCIDSVIAQNHPSDQFEILVIVGMSTDSTRDKVAEYQRQDHPRIRLLDNPGKIVPTGMNLALREAKGEIIIRVDGHTMIESDYVNQCVNILESTGADNVGGKMTALSTTRFGHAVAEATSHPFGIGDAKFHYSDKQEWVDSVYMGAWPRRVFEEIGLFDEDMVRNQDDEFNYRLRRAGGRILLHPDIRSKYSVRNSPRALWNQYFHYGLWKVRVLQKHPREMSVRQFVPPAFVLSIIISFILILAFSSGWISLVAIAGLYLVVNLLFSLTIAKKKGWQLLGLLPVAFAIIHISYGLGFLVGLFKFWNRWHDKIGKVPQWPI